MELGKKAREEALGFAMASFDAVTSDQSQDVKDWKAVFEAAFQCILDLGSTEAVQLFAMMCISSLDFFTYSELEDALLSHPKDVYADNMVFYSELNKKEKNSSE